MSQYLSLVYLFSDHQEPILQAVLSFCKSETFSPIITNHGFTLLGITLDDLFFCWVLGFIFSVSFTFWNNFLLGPYSLTQFSSMQILNFE